jgi:hypothetical protein
MKSWQLVAIFLVCASANVEAASINISIDDDSTSVPLTEVPKTDGPGSKFIIGNSEEESFTYETANGRVVLGGVLDPDPSIFFGSVAFDFGTPSSFGLSFVLPLTSAISNPSNVFDSFSGSVTNGPAPQSDGGVKVEALPPPANIPVDNDGVTEIEVFTLSADNGLNWTNVGLDLGPTTTVPLPAGNSGLYGNYNEGPIATVAGGPWTDMRADINFKLSGNGDIFTFNGSKVLVPEPGTVLLALLSIATPGLLSRRSPSLRRPR